MGITWLPGLGMENFPGTGQRQKAMQRRFCRELLIHNGHTSKVKEAVGHDGDASESTRLLALPLLSPQAIKKEIDDTSGDDGHGDVGINIGASDRLPADDDDDDNGQAAKRKIDGTPDTLADEPERKKLKAMDLDNEGPDYVWGVDIRRAKARYALIKEMHCYSSNEA